MTREIFVVCTLSDLGWVDVAELNDEDSAFLMCDEFKKSGVDAKVVRRWVGEDHKNIVFGSK